MLLKYLKSLDDADISIVFTFTFSNENLTIPTHLSLFIYFSVHVSHHKDRIKRCNLSQNQAHNQHTGMRIYMIDMLKCTPTQLCLPIELL